MSGVKGGSPLLPILSEVTAWRAAGIEWDACARKASDLTGHPVNGKALRELWKYHKGKSPPPKPPEGAPAAPEPETWELASERGTDQLELERFLTLAKVDRATWEVERYVLNRWEVGSMVDGRIITEPLYQLKVWLRRIKGLATIRAMWNDFLADVKAKAAPAVVLRHRPIPAEERHLLEIAPVDAHFGKLAWEPESGDSYDLKIARECWRDAISDNLRKSAGFPIDRALLVVSNDGLHFDNYQQTTTGGTFQDADTRYPKMFTTYWTECRWAADQIKLRAPVSIIVVPGNHDRQSAYCIGEVLSAWYGGSKDQAVTVDNQPRLRKYVRYGATLLGFTHGSEEKHNDLPLIMASEAKDDWALTIHHEWHTGHFHKAKETRYTAADSFGGVRVRILPSLAGHDAWHYSKGYSVERRAAEAYLFHYRTGYAGHFSSNVMPEAVA